MVLKLIQVCFLKIYNNQIVNNLQSCIPAYISSFLHDDFSILCLTKCLETPMCAACGGLTSIYRRDVKQFVLAQEMHIFNPMEFIMRESSDT